MFTRMHTHTNQIASHRNHPANIVYTVLYIYLTSPYPRYVYCSYLPQAHTDTHIHTQVYIYISVSIHRYILDRSSRHSILTTLLPGRRIKSTCESEGGTNTQHTYIHERRTPLPDPDTADAVEGVVHHKETYLRRRNNLTHTPLPLSSIEFRRCMIYRKESRVADS